MSALPPLDPATRTSNDESLSPAAALLLAIHRPEAESVLRRLAPTLRRRARARSRDVAA